MSANIYRVAIIGASSLAGKELSAVLSDSPMQSASFALFDEDETAGQLAVAADEISFVRKLDESSFDGVDLVYFAGSQESAKRHLPAARKAGADVIDLTGGLVRAPGARIGCGDLKQGKRDSLEGPRVIIVPHPASSLLAAVATQLQSSFGLSGVRATVLLSASEYGRAAVGELHRQTVNILGFQSVTQDYYDTQVAFDLVNQFSDAAKVSLDEVEDRIQLHYRALMPVKPGLSLQVVHAPVFHGLAASIFVEVLRPATSALLQQLFTDNRGSVSAAQQFFELGAAPTPLGVSGASGIAIRPRIADDGTGGLNVDVWAAADNLRILASSAADCALALRGEDSGIKVH